MKMLFLHQGLSDQSTRLRVHPWFPKLAGEGIVCDEAPKADWRYPTVAGPRWRRLPGYLAVARSAAELLRAPRYDVVFMQRTLFPHRLAALDELLRVAPRLMIDVADAVFCSPDDDRPLYAERLRRLCAMAHSILVSNAFMAKWVDLPEKTFVMPTVVDCDAIPARDYGDKRKVVIGWTGLANQLDWLRPLFPVLRDLVKRHDVEIIFHTSTIAQTPELSDIGIHVIPFDPARELEVLQSIDIGLLPLARTVFTLGKCPVKLIQYMAGGAAAVCSPIGDALEMVDDGVQGCFAETPDEWHDRLERLIEDRATREAMGRAGRERAEQRYSVRANWPRFWAAVAHAMAARS